jgi:hypothetical protein
VENPHFSAVEGDHVAPALVVLLGKPFIRKIFADGNDVAGGNELRGFAGLREVNNIRRIAGVNAYIFTPDAVEQVDLATGVAGFNVRYYDRAAQLWVDVWDGQGRTTLPAAVMIELTLLNSRKQPRTYTQYVLIPSQAS